MADSESEDHIIGSLGSDDELPWEDWRQWPDEIEQDTAQILPNLGGCIEYQNVIFQMLFHYPVFLQWLNYYYLEHSGRDRRCTEGFDGMDCKLCQFLHLARNYWAEDREECLSRHQAFVNTILADWDGGSRAGREQNILAFYIELQSQFRHQIPNDDRRSVYRRAHRFRDEFSQVFSFETFQTRECRGPNPCPPPIRGEETPYNWAIQVGNDPALSLMMHPAAEMFSWGEDGICENCFRNPIMARNVVEEPPELIVIRAPRKLFSRRDLGSILTSVELSSYLELKQGVFHDQFVKTEDVRYELFAVFVQVAPRRAEQPEITDENEPVDDYRSMFKAKSQWAEFPEENEEGPFLINDIDDWEWNSGLASIDYKRRGYVLAFRRLAEGIIPSKRSIEYQTSRLDDLAVGFNANIIPNPGVMTLTFEVGEGSGEGPEGSTTNPDTIVDRVRMRAVPFADLIMTIPMDSLQFPENNPTGRLLIEFQDRQNQVVETFEMRGILRDLLNKRPKEEPEAKKHNGVKKTRRRRSRVRDALRNALRRKEKKEEGEEGEGN